MSLVFILSLPRSGSTLLQRMLCTQERIGSIAEPWVLLPILYKPENGVAFSDYDVETCDIAVKDFYCEVNGGESRVKRDLCQVISRIYAEIADEKGCEIFIDKTPRYTLVAEELVNYFPDAKFIVLYRNPLAVAASIIKSFSQNVWRMDHYYIDLFEGLSNLTSTVKKHSDRFIVVRYEELVSNPAVECGRVIRQLGLQPDIEKLSNPSEVSFKGEMGDKSGVKKYTGVSVKSVDAWAEFYCNPFRKRWGRWYLKSLGPNVLTDMGYNYNEIDAKLKAQKAGVSMLGSDIIRFVYGKLDLVFGIWMLRKRLVRFLTGKPVRMAK
ncbi:sulfotransferase [Granulosicoccaceae sp. 1_MG-2023]|nr:sulfotransferase [Granulosicoccaceae sp. 1_MG-2023]